MMRYVRARWCVKFDVATVYKIRDGNLKGKIYIISTILEKNKLLRGQVIKKQYAHCLWKHLSHVPHTNAQPIKKFASTI